MKAQNETKREAAPDNTNRIILYFDNLNRYFCNLNRNLW